MEASSWNVINSISIGACRWLMEVYIMLVKDAGIPAKKTTKTYAGTGSTSLLELQSSKRISPTASEFLEMHNPKSSTYVGSTLLSPLKEKIHTTTKPSGTRPDSNVSNASGTSNGRSITTISACVCNT